MRSIPDSKVLIAAPGIEGQTAVTKEKETTFANAGGGHPVIRVASRIVAAQPGTGGSPARKRGGATIWPPRLVSQGD